MEVGVSLVAWFRGAARLASRMEQLGFQSVLFTDSQNLCPEVWSQLALAAQATQCIHLGPGVTNPVTRDPALTACAAVTLQAESDGRARLCLGRGDSAVQRIGRREQPVAAFATYLEALQAYLRGESVDRDGFPSRLEYLAALGELPKVPVEVMATGPRVIELAARLADRICFAVGADPEFLASRLALARAAAEAAGRDPQTLRLGAMLNCVVHDDLATARQALRGGAASFARFSSFRGNDTRALPAPLREAVAHLEEHYDMRHHTRADAAHTRGLSDAFLDWFGVAGPTERVVSRFRKLADLGLDFAYVVPGSTGADRAVVSASLRSLASAVLPAVATPA